MSKKRKTRKEKMKATIRQSSSFSQETTIPVYTFGKISVIEQRESVKTKEKNTGYAYVVKDMRQTFLITSILIASSIALHFLVQNQILRFNVFGY